MIAVLFVALAVALIIGPIMMMQPNARQRREIAYRDKALSLGLKVHLLPLPLGQGSRQVPAYCLPWRSDKADARPWLLVKGTFDHELHFCSHWDWFGDQPAAPEWHSPLKHALNNIPDSILAIANGPQGLCVFWNEKGDLSLLDEFVSLLQPLAEIAYER